MPKITELTNRELIKKLIAFLEFESFFEFKKLTYQQLVCALEAKKEDVQKQSEYKILRERLFNINQEKWEQLLKEEEQLQQEEQALVKQIKQSKAPHIVAVKTTDNMKENTYSLFILSPEDQENTINTIYAAYSSATGGQSPERDNYEYENIDEFLKNQPNINLTEDIRTLFTQGPIRLHVYILTFNSDQLQKFISNKEMATLSNEKNIHFVDVEKTNQENQVCRQFIFFSRPAFSLNKKTDEDNEKEYQGYTCRVI